MTVTPTRQRPAWLQRLERRLWRRVALRNLSGTDNFRQLDKLYAVGDPWDMASDMEQARFASTNDLARKHFGFADHLLEIGCGEGHQTVHLQAVAKRITAIDVSVRAVRRARIRAPAARLIVGDLGALAVPPRQRYDVVVAAEVLYYMRSIPQALAQMNALGHACLLTCFAPAGARLAPHLAGLRDLERGWFSHGGVVWLYALWFPLGRTVPADRS
jgi:SAM-dependent methyltransferase